MILPACLLAFLHSLVDVAASQTATMLYEMIGIVSDTLLPPLRKHCTRSLRTILLTRSAPLQVRPGNLAEVKEYALPAPVPQT